MQDKSPRSKEALNFFSIEELKQLYYSLGGKESLDGYSRNFIIEKIQRLDEFRNLLSNKTVLMLINRLGEMLSYFRKNLEQLEAQDLLKICKNFGVNKHITEDSKKSDIIKTLLSHVSIHEISKNKLVMQRLKPKYVTISDIKSLKKELELLKSKTEETSDNIDLLNHSIQGISDKLETLSLKLERFEGLFDIGSTPSLQAYLKALYDERILLNEKLSPESFRDVIERLQQRLGVDNRTFILKGIELFLVHYFLSHIKELSWKPDFEVFITIIKEEFDKIKIAEDKAEIPKLRMNVTRRMGISDEMFDEMLIDAWKKGYVKLDVGAPIGEYDVKYLITPEGNRFYYIKLLK